MFPKRLLLAASLAAIHPVIAANGETAPVYTAASVRAHVEFLADDLLDGREAGTKNYDIAARYVATRFAAAGLEAPVAGGWYQRVPLVSSLLDEAKPASITIGGKKFPHKQDVLLSPSVQEALQDIEAAVVFAGYCLDKPDQGVDDYAKLDVKGKFVACLSGFPKGMASDVGAHLASRKSIMAQGRGAIGMISIPTIQSARTFPWERNLIDADRPSMGWLQADGTTYREAPRIRIGAYLNRPAATALFEGAPRPLEEVLAEADREGGKPAGFALKPRVRIERTSAMRRFESPNVLGLLRGSDPALAGEVVVLMAHLDHTGPEQTMLGDRIRNGAVDNAAGVAILLEVARAMAASPVKPKRSVLFAAVTAEETGLLGSQYLARHPVVAGAQSVAVVNLDAPMLLYDFKDVIAFGAEHSTMGPVLARAAARMDVKSSPDPMPEQGIFTRSDHYSFVKEGVPGIFLVTGWANGGQKVFGEYLSKHYHRPSDQLDLPFDWNAAVRFAQLNELIAREIADAPARPLWYGDSLFGKTYAPTAPKASR